MTTEAELATLAKVAYACDAFRRMSPYNKMSNDDVLDFAAQTWSQLAVDDECPEANRTQRVGHHAPMNEAMGLNVARRTAGRFALAKDLRKTKTIKERREPSRKDGIISLDGEALGFLEVKSSIRDAESDGYVVCAFNSSADSYHDGTATVGSRHRLPDRNHILVLGVVVPLEGEPCVRFFPWAKVHDETLDELNRRRGGKKPLKRLEHLRLSRTADGRVVALLGQNNTIRTQLESFARLEDAVESALLYRKISPRKI